VYQGLQAFRYRLTRTRNPHSLHEVVNSDQLFLQLEQSNWERYPEVETVLRLTDIHLGEPSKELFEIPEGSHLGVPVRE